MKTVDAIGYTCPQPIMKMVSAMKSDVDELEIKVDNETSKENIIRTAKGRKWEIIDVFSEDDIFTITIKKV